jgi:integrase/recombinase XerD
VAIIRGFYGYLTAKGVLDRDPMGLLRAPTVHNRRPRALLDGTWRKAWGAALDGDDDTAVVVLGFGGLFGFRRAEIVSLAATHLQVSGQVTSFVRKGGGDDVFPYRTVMDVWQQQMPDTIGDGGAARLEAVIGACVARGGPLLPGWVPDTVNRRLDGWIAEYGVPRFTPHALRHTFVTNMLRAGVPIELVSELANHSNIAVTMRYVKGGQDRVAEWLTGQTVRAANHHQSTLAQRFGLA